QQAEELSAAQEPTEPQELPELAELSASPELSTPEELEEPAEDQPEQEQTDPPPDEALPAASSHVPDPPPLPITTRAHPSRQRRSRIPFVAALLILMCLVGVGMLFSSHFFDTAASGGSGTGLGFVPALSPDAPIVQPPFTSAQMAEIMHLSGYMKDKALASLYVAHMTLDEELGQLIMVEYDSGCYTGTCSNATSYYSPDLDTMLNTLHAGGVIMYEFQMQNFPQTKNDIAEMQRRAGIPLLIATDEEGGPYVHRLSHIYGYRMSATDIANTGDPNIAAQQGAKAAQDLLSLGINVNLAPDVDVNLVNGYDMVTRTFGSTPQAVVKFASSYLEALQGDGVIGTIKHFPGLGDAVTDAHTTLPVVNRTRDQLYSVELAPFKAFIQTSNPLMYPGIIMPTDVLMPAIDPVYPAELSHTFMTDILRNEFGYDGVVLTDALYMQGIIEKWDMNTAAVLALNAGNDMLLGPTGAGQMLSMINALKAALANGTLSKARIDQAATRIITLKMEYHLMPAAPPQE
ncbi:MAG TPA: glycoside hydrolase family 3 N-terminal domain-containing protein, partial [Ktedonobacteraceae bacterium]|nr:glycoside hydrolase family 3 N-terminal domain-containing protein [Ktedonobacteraceae bacterium]